MHRHAKRAAALIDRPYDSIGLQGDLGTGMGQPIAVNVTGLRRTRNQYQQEADDRRKPHPERMGRKEASVFILLGHRVQLRAPIHLHASVRLGLKEELFVESRCVRYFNSTTANEYPLLLGTRNRSLPAGRATSGQEELMTGHLKAFGKIRLELNAAAGHLEDLAALIAAKMMVMFLARNFIASRLPGQSDRGQPVLFHQSADIAIAGCYADPFHQLSGVTQRLFRRKRPIRTEKRRANGIFLPRLS